MATPYCPSMGQKRGRVGGGGGMVYRRRHRTAGFLPAGGEAPAEEEKRHTRQRDGFGGGWAGGEITWLAAGASDCSCAKLTSAGTYRRLPSPQNGPREGCQLFATRIGQWKCRSRKDASKLKQPAKTGEKVSWNPKENLWEKQKKMQNKRY